jgi:hypothetical protein
MKFNAMQRCRRSSRLASAVLIFAACSAATRPSLPTFSPEPTLPSEISIHVAWSGLASGRDETYVIRISDGVATLGGKGVPIALVQNLVQQVDSPIMQRATAVNVGMTASWLSQHASDYRTIYADAESMTPREARFFSETFERPLTVSTFLNGEFSSGFIRTDDYPSADLTLTWANGTSIHLWSRSQVPYMIPWHIQADSNQTYNAGIGRAIASVLPSDAVNRGRLGGDPLLGEYIQFIYDFYQSDELQRLRAEDIMGSRLRYLESRFVIDTLQIAREGSDDLDGQYALLAQLMDPRLGRSVVVNLCLFLSEDNQLLTPIATAIAAERRYTGLVLQVPWLRAYLRSHPAAHVEIRVMNDASISEKLATSLLQDLDDHEHQRLASMIRRELPQIAFVYLDTGGTGPGGPDYARWFVLPDHRMLLWNYKGGTPLESEIAGLPTWDWYGHTDVQALFDPYGRLITQY